MRELGIGDAPNINQYVKQKLLRFAQEEKSFETLFKYMFSERDNILYERSYGYRIEYTSYGEAYDEILRIAGCIAKLLREVPRDSIVGLYMENSLEWIELFWGIIVAGYRPLLMNTKITDEVLSDVSESVQVRAVISNSEKNLGCPTINCSELLDKNISCDNFDLQSQTFGSEVLFMSSGTSENIKICAYSAEEFFWQISDSYYIIKKCKLMKKHYNGKIKQLTLLPFYHIFGFTAVYLWFAFFSRTLVHLDNLSGQTVLNTIRRHEVTHIFAVPLFWDTVYKQAVRTIKDRDEKTIKKFDRGLKISKSLEKVSFLSNLFSRIAFKQVRDNLFGESISFMISGGSEISEEILVFFNSVGYRLANGYGMTEVGITSVELEGDRRRLNSCSVGVPFQSVKYKISDGGELLINAKTAAKYVISDGKIQKREEWFNTHDLAQMGDGGYKILGRLDDIVIGSNGENLNPNLIEPMINRETCLIKKDDKPVLLVYVRGYVTKARFADIRTEVNAQLESLGLSNLVGCPVYVREPFVKDDEFKKNRHRISEDYKAGRLSVIENDDFENCDSGCPDDEIKKHIRELFSQALQRSESEFLDTSNFFLEAGGNSLDYFTLISQIQNDYNVTIPIERSMELTTVNKICEYLEEELKNVD